MGIGHHELRMLKIASEARPLGEVLTFGRQNLNMARDDVAKTVRAGAELQDQLYVDEVLTTYLGATSVSAVDYSGYEGATYTRDLNKPFDLGRQFDLVLDSGTLEHVFDVAAAFRNAISHCKVGGRIMHALPSNSDCGHGFYQISPELMLSLYSKANGFANTAVYMVKVMDEKHWWRVSPAEPGERIMVNSLSTTYVLCMTEKVAEVPNLTVQQSDYEHAWKVGKAHVGERRPSFVGRARAALRGTAFADIATLGYRTWLARTGLTRLNPHLRKSRIDAEG